MKKIICFIILMLMVPSVYAYSPVRPDTGTEKVVIVESGKTEMQIDFAKGFVIGQRFYSSSPVRSVTFRCISWGNNIGKVKVSAYNWQGDYSKTVSQSPATVFVSQDMEDNLVSTLTLPDNADISGDVLFVYEAEYPGCKESVGTTLVSSKKALEEQTTFVNGEEKPELAMMNTITCDAVINVPDLSGSPLKNAKKI